MQIENSHANCKNITMLTKSLIPDIENDCGQYFDMYLSKTFKAFIYKSVVYTTGAS